MTTIAIPQRYSQFNEDSTERSGACIEARIGSRALPEGHSGHGPGPAAGRYIKTGVSRRAGKEKDRAYYTVEDLEEDVAFAKGSL